MRAIVWVRSMLSDQRHVLEASDIDRDILGDVGLELLAEDLQVIRKRRAGQVDDQHITSEVVAERTAIIVYCNPSEPLRGRIVPCFLHENRYPVASNAIRGHHEQGMNMDPYLNIVSKRDVRRYTDEPIPDDVLTRILHAGRATGSARNRQQWEMVVVRNRETLARLAETVSAPANIRGCVAAVAVVLTGQSAWDGGRMAQNLMLAAWSQGVGTCPNTPVQKDECKAILGVAEDADVLTILSLGYPAEPVPRATDAGAILSRIDRKPLGELTRYLD